MKPDEKHFLMKMLQAWWNRLTPRDLINSPGLPMHHKRAWYLLEKWADKGWYEYGVTLDLGWLTTEGKIKAIELINEGSVNK